jgi:protoporphyrinogen oxidase
VRGGYARILEKFAEHLKEKGVDIRLDSVVLNAKTQDHEDAKIMLEYQTKDSEPKMLDFDKIVLTCPSNIAAKILPQLTKDEKQKLENIKYQGIVCASVLMKNSLSNFYVTNITDETPFTGIIEMSALVDKKEFGGNALVYLPKYVAPDDKLFEKSDAEIEEIFVSALEKMYSHFKREDVVEFKISRVRNVFPIPTLRYSANVPDVKTSLKNVFIVNSAQITNGTLNVNETVMLAEKFFENYLQN